MVLKHAPYTIASYGLSDPGLVRENNEDVWGCLPGHHFYVVADGMGGHQAGEVAAREAVIFLCTELRKILDTQALADRPAEDVMAHIRSCVEDTNQFIYELSTSHELLGGMGTTLCCLYFHKDYVIWGHVGDSRIYRLRKGRLEQLTQDDSLLRELTDGGRLVEYDADEFAYKNIITKAIGTEQAVSPAMNCAIVEPHDLFLLCTDGLSELLAKEEIEAHLNQPYTVEEKVRALIAAAKQKGGYDNITTVLVEVEAANDRENISR
jgi:protein phosphatase